MSIRFHCEHCGKKLKAGAHEAGTRFKCSGCGRIGMVPRWSSPAEHKREGSRSSEMRLAAKSPVAPMVPEPPLLRPPRSIIESELDMTPMVDVVFQLLIFFMLTAAFAKQKSLEVPTPDAQQNVAQSRTIEELEKDDDYIIVHIDRDNIVWVNDREAPTRQELAALIREVRDTGSHAPQNLLVLHSGEARHERVVMVLDVGNSLAIDNIRLAMDEGELE